MPPSARDGPRRRSRGVAQGKRFVIIASEFHAPLARALVRGATHTLRRHGVADSQVRLLWAPGAFELPVIAARIARGRPRPHAIIAVGALIRGETPQYEILAHAVADGLGQVAVQSGIPVTNGVVLAKTMAQARARAGLPVSAGRRGPPRREAGVAAPKRRGRAAQAGGHVANRGAEAAAAALAVLRLFETLT